MLLVLGALAYSVLQVLHTAGSRHGAPYGSARGSGTPSAHAATACAQRIASQLPNGSGAELVTAYRTSNKQITLCRTGGGTLYYFGEFTGRPDTGLAMPATQTADGFTADNGPYHYRISGNTVTVTENGKLIGQEQLTAVSSPQ
ncbi:hypothetical protein [Streptomyces tateyamensis]|uniref:hypothetical protein n=1 Tax=Streptomyces tateyamensis TaxID=565073 RepID=UPI001C649B9B|nr:hypothetical protein [Streptomyces tateyamensis]